MKPHRGDGCRKAAVFTVHDTERRVVGPGRDVRRADIGVLGLNTEPDSPQTGRNLCGRQQVIVGVQHQRGAVRQAGADFHLCLQYILPGAEIFQMRDTDHRDNACGRAGAAAQPLDLTRMVHPHFNHGILGGIVQPEQRVGHADVIVLVAFGLECFAERGQHRVAKFLGRSLAHAAGDADHFGAEKHPVVGGHADHGTGAVRHDNSAIRRDPLDRVVGDDIGGAVTVGTGGKIVSIDTLAGEADKDAARLDLAAVRNDCMDADRLGQRQAGQQLIGRNLLHEKGPPWVGLLV